jgi:hypothetical protein
LCGVASAGTLLNVTDTLVETDSTQLGRLSRNGVAQDWVGSEPFPGVINAGTTYFYHTYSVNVGATTFIQVEFDDVSTSEFVSAYLGDYLPISGLDVNWLGDAGTSEDYFGTDPLFFQVIVPAHSTLVLVVNNTTGGATLPASNGTYNLLVEGFFDSQFSDAPEPSGMILMTAALGALGVAFRRRVRKSNSLC